MRCREAGRTQAPGRGDLPQSLCGEASRTRLPPRGRVVRPRRQCNRWCSVRHMRRRQRPRVHDCHARSGVGGGLASSVDSGELRAGELAQDSCNILEVACAHGPIVPFLLQEEPCRRTSGRGGPSGVTLTRQAGLPGHHGVQQLARRAALEKEGVGSRLQRCSAVRGVHRQHHDPDLGPAALDGPDG